MYVLIKLLRRTISHTTGDVYLTVALYRRVMFIFSAFINEYEIGKVLRIEVIFSSSFYSGEEKCWFGSFRIVVARVWMLYWLFRKFG